MTLPWTNKRLWRTLLGVYLAAVLFLCFGKFEPTDDIPSSFLGIPMDKIAHFLMFSPWVVLWLFACFYKSEIKASGPFRGILIALTGGIAFAAMTELGQGMSGYRSMEAADLLSDSLGIVAGALASVIFLIIQHKKKARQ